MAARNNAFGLLGICHCHFCVTQFPRNCLVDGTKCPNCHVELINGKEDDVMMPVISSEGIFSTDSFVEKVKKLRDKFEIITCEIGHGYAVLESKWEYDTNNVEAFLKSHLTGVFRGFDINRDKKHLLLIDNGYDATKPDVALPPIIMGDDTVDTVAPNEDEEEEQPNDNDEETKDA